MIEKFFERFSFKIILRDLQLTIANSVYPTPVGNLSRSQASIFLISLLRDELTDEGTYTRILSIYKFILNMCSQNCSVRKL